MNILLTGGAGYIGSHTAVTLLQEGHSVVIYDNLSNSESYVIDRIRQITKANPVFIVGDILDEIRMIKVLRNHKIDAVIHFAGLKAVGESNEIPLDYYDNNVAGTIRLLDAMKIVGVTKLVFSSSATVYGNAIPPIHEDMPTGGVTNPYGRTKLIIEKILQDYCKADGSLSILALRYFNPIGAHESGLIGENPKGIPNNLLPYVAKVAKGELDYLRVFGGDYDTPDGTGIRDYIHVVDLAKGHAMALDYLDKNKGFDAINLGTGQGYSVLEVIKTFEEVSGQKVPYKIVERRAGDVAMSWASSEKAFRLLGWKAYHGLEKMCIDLWNQINCTR